MSLRPYIAGWAYVPLIVLGRSVDIVKKRLTITPRQFNKDEPPEPIHLYDPTVEGFLGLPIDWALKTYPQMQFEDRTVMGGECYYNKLPDPHHPRAAPGQADFMEDMAHAAANYYTVLGKAQTGCGKTVVALRTAALRGRRTLITVHLERLARQWAEEINDKLGVPFDDIGWVQGDICNWNKPYVLAISNSLAGRRYPKEFYEAFGTVIYDEVHRVGAPLFSRTVGQFSANVKIGLTATDKRKDGCEKVFYYYFGEPCVRSTQEAMPTTVHSLEYPSRVPQWTKMHGGLVAALAEDHDRNLLITRIIKKMHVNGRNMLVIGDKTEHLQELIQMAGRAGVPFSEMGLFVNQRYSTHTRDSYSKVKAAVPRQTLVYWPKANDESPAFDKFQQVRVIERTGNGYYRVEALNRGSTETSQAEVHLDELRSLPKQVPVLVKVPHDELDRIKATSRIIFATYGMLKEGIDIPRLDAGMDVTPRADGEQVLGRIRRRMPGKPKPIWYTFKDEGHPALEGYWRARVKDYRGCGAEVIEYGEIG